MGVKIHLRIYKWPTNEGVIVHDFCQSKLNHYNFKQEDEYCMVIVWLITKIVFNLCTGEKLTIFSWLHVFLRLSAVHHGYFANSEQWPHVVRNWIRWIRMSDLQISTRCLIRNNSSHYKKWITFLSLLTGKPRVVLFVKCFYIKMYFSSEDPFTSVSTAI